jgi:hypothetical protein
MIVKAGDTVVWVNKDPFLQAVTRPIGRVRSLFGIRADTVGQPPGAEICVSNMPALKAKKLRKLPREKVLLEL